MIITFNKSEIKMKETRNNLWKFKLSRNKPKFLILSLQNNYPIEYLILIYYYDIQYN